MAKKKSQRQVKVKPHTRGARGKKKGKRVVVPGYTRRKPKDKR